MDTTSRPSASSGPAIKTIRMTRTKKRQRLCQALGVAMPNESTSATPETREPNDEAPEVLLRIAQRLISEIRSLDDQLLGHPELSEDDSQREIDYIDLFDRVVDPAIVRLELKVQACTFPDPSGLYRTTASSTPVRPRVRFEDANEGATGRNDYGPTFAERPIYRAMREIDIAPERFTGQRLKFRKFRTQFECWLEGQAHATDSQRLMILVKSLEGEPKGLVEHLELTDRNYRVAWNILEQNYACTDTEQDRLISELRHLSPRVGSPYDVVSLKALLNKVQINTQILESMGIPLRALAPFLRNSLEAAIAPKLRQDFKDALRMDERFNKALGLGLAVSSEQDPQQPSGSEQLEHEGDSHNLSKCEKMAAETEKLISFLRRRVIDLEESKHLDRVLQPERPRDCEDPSRRGSYNKSYPGKKTYQHTVASVNSGKQLQKFPQKRRPCLFCSTTEHNTSRCPAEISYERRCDTLKRLQRCIKCFAREHENESECGGPRVPCGKCKSKQHYTVMHRETSSPPVTSIPSEITAGAVSNHRSALLATISAFIVNGGAKIPVRLFLDSGSSTTFISPNVRRLLTNEAPVGRASLNVQAFSSAHHIKADRFAIRLINTHCSTPVELLAYEYEFGVNPSNRCPLKILKAVQRFSEQHPLADSTLLGARAVPPPAILVGQDQLYNVLIPCKQEIVTDDLWASKTKFGWTIAGSISQAEPAQRVDVAAVDVVCCSTTLSQGDRLSSSQQPPSPATRPARDLERLWFLDTIGINEGDGRESVLTAEEQSAVSQFEKSVYHEGDQYVVAFPKRESIQFLRNNMAGARDRLERKLKQLKRNPKRYERYHTEIMGFVRDGHATEIGLLTPGALSEVDGSYYMPHREVVTGPESARKWRIVFDCSAKTGDSSSLNDHLLVGPNLNPDLVTLLLNFRMHPVAVSADITKAYMRILISPPDRPFFRFLWRFPGESQTRIFQMRKVTWGAASSGFLLAATLREHFRRSESCWERELSRCFYADDFLRAFRTDQQAIAFIDALRNTLAQAGMELAKWKSNSQRVVDHLISTGVRPETIDIPTSHVFKVLGISWCPTRDTLAFCIGELGDRLKSQTQLTKRFVLSLVASIYDPLGLLTPYSLRGKGLIQKLWSQKLEWDHPVPNHVAQQVREWISELRAFESFETSRQYGTKTEEPVAYRLHVFGDASQVAYACAAYLECRYTDGMSEFSLLMAKSRIAPREPPSLPRLELLAALLAVRLKKFIVERMDVEFELISFYTDSMITYYWATATVPGKWKTFVANRVLEIQANSRVEEWFFVQGEHNIADVATRGISADALIANASWWRGPQWLHLPSDLRPISRPKAANRSLSPVQDELRVTSAAISVSPPLIDLERYSSSGRAIRVLAKVIQFCRTSPRLPPTPVHRLYQEAETHIIKWTQQEFFSKEIEAAATNQRPPSSSKLSSFQIFLDANGLLRARTRLTEGPMLTYDEKNPIVIAGESRWARLLILDAHHINAHFGVNTILSYLRRRFWIVRARQTIKSILAKCVVCKKKQGTPAQQVEAPLPAERVNLIAPFSTTGLDFCGPFYTRTTQGTQKNYIALFTCATVRAVHLELVESMSTPQTHLALRRFLSTHPSCVRLVSDNWKSFVKAATDIKRLFNSIKDKEVKVLLQRRGIEWNFICPRAPWHGGFYERMVGSVKKALVATLGKSFVTFEELRTIVTELAAIINERPITYVSTDPNAPTPITPAQFIRGGPSIVPLAGVLPLDNLGTSMAATRATLKESHLQRTTYFKQLSVRWYREYLLELRSANETRGAPTPSIKEGDVCLLKDDNRPRVQWELVRIETAHIGRDGKVRTYTVKFSNGNVSKRAAQLLIPLEICE